VPLVKGLMFGRPNLLPVGLSVLTRVSSLTTAAILLLGTRLRAALRKECAPKEVDLATLRLTFLVTAERQQILSSD
jgi:hypothetical protein